MARFHGQSSWFASLTTHNTGAPVHRIGVCPEAGDRHVCGGHVMCEGRQPTATHWTGRWIRHRLIHNKPQNTTVGKSWNAKNETPYDNVQINAVGDRAHQAHGMASHDTPRVRIERGAGDLECGQGAK
jgi:hypothetical protein